MQLDVEVSPPAFVRDIFKGIYYGNKEQAITIIARIFYQGIDGHMDK